MQQHQAIFFWKVAVLLLASTSLYECNTSGDVFSELSSKASCPDTWFVPTGANHTCRCGDTFNGIVACNEDTKEVKVVDCYCITFAKNTVVLSECLFNCLNVTKSYSDFIYHPVPRDIVNGDHNNSICGYLNRKGTSCGACVEGYYPAVYSYKFECMDCDSALLSSWPEYILIAYGPLTLFIVFILVFRVSVVSPSLYGVVSMLQTLASPLNIRLMSAAARYNPVVNIMAQIVLTLLGMWNLDFFRTLLPGICLRINSLQVLALDYMIAVYPMIVTVIAFTILELHNCGFKPVMCILRPFYYVFARFRKEWNLRTTLIDAFVTFFILSTTKLLHVSVSLLLCVILHRSNGKAVDLHLYVDATIEYFGPTHRPCAILAIFVTFFLLVMPVCLLLSFQFTCCQKCLTRARLKGYVLDEIMYTFNQYYKDGTEGSMDCRWFAAFHVVTRMGFYAIPFFSLTSLTYNLFPLYTLVCAIVVILVEPYRKEYKIYNVIEPCLYLLLALYLVGVTAVNISNVQQRAYLQPLFIYVGTVGLLPLLYLFVVTVWWVHQRGMFGFKLTSTRDLTPDLPDRLLNSGNYGNFNDSDHTQSTIECNSVGTVNSY